MRSAGGKRAQITLQHVTQTQSSSGQPVETWATYATVLGEFRTLRGMTYYAQQSDHAATEGEIVIHYRSDVLASDRVLLEGSAYELTAPPVDLDYRHRETLLRVRRIV